MVGNKEKHWAAFTPTHRQKPLNTQCCALSVGGFSELGAPRGFEYHPFNGGAGRTNRNTPEGMSRCLCPFADLFRTTFPEIRGKYSETGLLFQESNGN
jgi:hypothetical protein